MLLWIGSALAGLLFMKRNEVKEEIKGALLENSANWTKWDSLFRKYADRNALEWRWLKAIAMNESSLGTHPTVVRGFENPNDTEGSKSTDGKSWGLMQVTLVTAKDFDPLATPAKLNNAEYSIDLAARVFKRNMAYFSKADPRYLEWVVKSYNQGAGNSKKEMNGWRGPYYDHVQEYWARFQRNLERVKSK